MKFETIANEIKSKFPDIYRVFLGLVDDLKSLLNNFNADSNGISFGELKWSKKGLLESIHGIFVRNQIESDTPISASYRQTIALPGAGVFTWDTLDVENPPGYFARITGNAQIQIFRPGYYLIAFHGLGYGLAAGARGDASINRNGVVYSAVLEYTGVDGYVQFNCTIIMQCNANDIIDVPSNIGRTGLGAPGFPYFARLSIHKLN